MKIIEKGNVTVEFTTQELGLIVDCLHEFNMKNWIVAGYPPTLLYNLLVGLQEFKPTLDK